MDEINKLILKSPLNYNLFLQKMSLHVTTTNRAAHLYERQGYTITETTGWCGLSWCLTGVKVS